MAYNSFQYRYRWIEDLENNEGTIHLLAMTKKALEECKCKLDLLLEARTLNEKEIDERNAHLAYSGMRRRIPYTLRLRTDVRKRKSNVNGFFLRKVCVNVT